MLNSWYIADWKVVIARNWPGELAWAQTLLDLCYVASKGIRMVYADFLAYRTKTLKNIGPTPGVAEMEDLLNNAFDPERRGIYLYNPVRIPQDVLIYWDFEDKPAPIIYRVGETDLEEDSINRVEEDEDFDDFTVYVPDDIAVEVQVQIRALTAKNCIYKRKFGLATYPY